jgi:hypothetical protein
MVVAPLVNLPNERGSFKTKPVAKVMGFFRQLYPTTRKGAKKYSGWQQQQF